MLDPDEWEDAARRHFNLCGIYLGLKGLRISSLWGLCIYYNDTWTLWVRTELAKGCLPTCILRWFMTRGSKYPTFKVSGPQNHTSNDFWNQEPQTLALWASEISSLRRYVRFRRLRCPECGSPEHVPLSSAWKQCCHEIIRSPQTHDKSSLNGLWKSSGVPHSDLNLAAVPIKAKRTQHGQVPVTFTTNPNYNPKTATESTVGARKLEHARPPIPNHRKKENQHTSSFIHVPTFGSLL